MVRTGTERTISPPNVSVPSAVVDGPGGQLRAAVLILARQMRHHQAEGMLSPSEAAVLGRVGRMGPITPAALARCEHVRPPSMTRILDRLVERGLVRKHPDPDDHRQILISRTAAGDDLAAEIRVLRTAWLAAQLGRLDDADRAAITSAVPALRRLAELA